jgi:hypothetical protein
MMRTLTGRLVDVVDRGAPDRSQSTTMLTGG